MLATVEQLIQEFQQVVMMDWQPPKDLLEAAESALQGCGGCLGQQDSTRYKHLLALINRKFRLNKDALQNFLDGAAAFKVFPNYHEKAELLECLDLGNKERFRGWLRERQLAPSLEVLFRPVSPEETLSALADQLRNGTITRRDARQCDVAERRESILRSLFGGYVFSSIPRRTIHSYFNSDCKTHYYADFYQHLKAFHPEVLNRECALIFLVLDEGLRAHRTEDELLDGLFLFISRAYERLSNHGYFAILIPSSLNEGRNVQWKLFSDIILYAEKHKEVKLQTGYFHPQKIEQATKEYIPHIDISRAKFEIANEGFFYRDCIVLPQHNVGRKVETTSVPVSLLLLFQKNERDETPIPCPACRSLNIAGNSYPAIGIRSWECQNPICPERSAFDRGNRYSLESLIKQEAIDSEEDQIPEWSLKKWKLDVVAGAETSAITDMLLRHFSLHKDVVLFVNSPQIGAEKHGRQIVYEPFPREITIGGIYEQFQDSSFFHRFIVDRDAKTACEMEGIPTGLPDVLVYRGDCFEVLSRIDDDSFDGAVTSPPYYNARDYTSWPNIYCYLYDMYNIAQQVYRVLKPGTVFLFNIFDYFDNENTIVFSSMGKKRMILGAYIVNLFRRVGFELGGNVVWFKGEIEGKRNYNQGNRSPYYQLPLNAWEHVFVFHKPDLSTRQYQFPTVLSAKPVFKIKGGKNVLGHTAPFPFCIPELLLNQMVESECILDPFSGSMTTGRAAFKQGIHSVSIDLHLEYCELGIGLLRTEKDGTLPIKIGRKELLAGV